ncbi:hypothetical protein WCX49_11805 [Sulfurimonas sp. HSL-1656]|uniref:hypothetical protein n=1 Tax=Thiomicrolovo subterrani TaxID=3131934 RepID=UPI0031F8987C
MGRRSLPFEERKINVPSWCLKGKYILAMERIAAQRNTTPSDLLNEIMAKFVSQNDPAKTTTKIT